MFAYDIRHWKTPDDLRKHLANHDPVIASWARGVVIHHTFRPLPSQWRGEASMRGLINWYSGLGWTAGPHLFVAIGSPAPENDGIWQLTPLNMRGIHAGRANAWSWGIEIVGNYDLEPWPAVVESYAVASTVELLRWRGIGYSPKSVLGHRETGSPKTCPGTKVDMEAFRGRVGLALEEK
jgi:hypothetical protein